MQDDSTLDFETVCRMAQSGDAKEQARLGVRYCRGEGVAQDPTEGFKWFLLSAEKGLPFAEYAVGRQLWTGQGTTVDRGEAVVWLLRGAEHGNANAQFMLANAFQTGTSVSANFTEAARWYRLAADQGHTDAGVYLWYLHKAGKAEGLSTDQALDYLAQCAEKGNLDALKQIAMASVTGQGAKKDYYGAMKWCRQLSKVDQDSTIFVLSNIYAGVCHLFHFFSFETPSCNGPKSEFYRTCAMAFSRFLDYSPDTKALYKRRLQISTEGMVTVESLYEKLLSCEDVFAVLDEYEAQFDEHP